MSNEGFHEIQLNGKQLVFLFMAATVVSVVIFLCGVMVGRGVRAERSAASDIAATSGGEGDSLSAPAAAEPDLAPAAGGGQPVPPALPPAPADNGAEEVYKDLVDGDGQDRLAKPEPIPAPSKSQEMLPPPTAARATPATPAQAPAVNLGPTEPGTYAVQLAALRERSEAEVIVKRLVAKGYQAYVLVPQPGAPPVYRVQVGRFKKRGEADRAAARLKREERFKPFVTR
jgi:hypothetical protein